MGPGAGCLGGFLPVVIEGDQLPLQERSLAVTEEFRGAFLLQVTQSARPLPPGAGAGS